MVILTCKTYVYITNTPTPMCCITNLGYQGLGKLETFKKNHSSYVDLCPFHNF